MKLIKYTCIVSCVALLVSLAFIHVGSAPTTPTMKITPTYYTGRAGGSIYVNLWIYDAVHVDHTDVYGWQVMLTWDTTVFDMDATIQWGDFLTTPRPGWWSVMTEDAAAGTTLVKVVDGSKYQAGYAVLIEDDYSSEENEVASVLGNDLTMMTALANTYTVAAGAGCHPSPDYTPASDIRDNRVLCGATTNGPAPGQSGNGWLATFRFTVVSVAPATLNIDPPSIGHYTYIINDLAETLGDETGELIKESGYFVEPKDEDFNADGAVDIFDLATVALKVPSGPGYVGPEDVNGDGYVNVIDLTFVSLEYGIYANA
jgi:hypothetical protein